MIVIVGGMPRSGSTFSFNIVREALAATGSVFSMATDNLSAALSGMSGEGHIVIKSHMPDEDITKLILAGAAPCVCTYRKPEEAVASWVRVFGYEVSQAAALMERWLQWHRVVAKKSLNLPFSLIEATPLTLILRIQRLVSGRARPFAAVTLRRRYGKQVVREQTAQLQGSETTINIGFSYYQGDILSSLVCARNRTDRSCTHFNPAGDRSCPQAVCTLR